MGLFGVQPWEGFENSGHTEASPPLKCCAHRSLFPAFCAGPVQNAGMLDGYPTTDDKGAAEKWSYFMHVQQISVGRSRRGGRGRHAVFCIYGEYGYGRFILDEDTCSLVRLVREWTALGLRCLSRSIIDFTHTHAAAFMPFVSLYLDYRRLNAIFVVFALG